MSPVWSSSKVGDEMSPVWSNDSGDSRYLWKTTYVPNEPVNPWDGVSNAETMRLDLMEKINAVLWTRLSKKLLSIIVEKDILARCFVIRLVVDVSGPDGKPLVIGFSLDEDHVVSNRTVLPGIVEHLKEETYRIVLKAMRPPEIKVYRDSPMKKENKSRRAIDF